VCKEKLGVCNERIDRQSNFIGGLKERIDRQSNFIRGVKQETNILKDRVFELEKVNATPRRQCPISLVKSTFEQGEVQF
jgi:hypothetical protein